MVESLSLKTSEDQSSVKSQVPVCDPVRLQSKRRVTLPSASLTHRPSLTPPPPISSVGLFDGVVVSPSLLLVSLGSDGPLAKTHTAFQRAGPSSCLAVIQQCQLWLRLQRENWRRKAAWNIYKEERKGRAGRKGDQIFWWWNKLVDS